MAYGVLSLFILTVPNLTLARLKLNHWPNRQHGTMGVFTEVVVGTRFFLRAVRGFFLVRKLLRTIFNNLILCQGLGLRCWVTLTVTITQSCLQMLRASLSERLV